MPTSCLALLLDNSHFMDKVMPMIIRDRLVSFFYRLGCSITGLILVIMVFVTSPSGSAPLTSLYVQTSLVLEIGFLLKTFFNGLDFYKKGRVGIPGGIWMPLALALLSYAMLGAVVFCLGDSPFNLAYTYMRLIAVIVLLVLGLADYFLFDEKGTVTWDYPLYWALYPTIYGGVMMVTPFITGYETVSSNFFSPRYFALSENAFLAGNDGWNGVAIAYVTLIAAYIVMAYILVYVNYLLGLRFRKQAKDAY